MKLIFLKIVLIHDSKERCKSMKREVDVTKIISNLSKIGVKATATKSRLELLKALAPPKNKPQTHN